MFRIEFLFDGSQMYLSDIRI